MNAGWIMLIIGGIIGVWAFANLLKKYGAFDVMVGGFIILSLLFIGGFYLAVKQEANQ